MWLLLVPVVILLVLVFLATALVGAVFSILGHAWPLLLIGAGIWLFWHEDAPRRRTRHYERGMRNSNAQPAPKQSRPAPVANGPRPLGQSELPIDVQVKVEQIRRKVDVLAG